MTPTIADLAKAQYILLTTFSLQNNVGLAVNVASS